MPPPAEGFAARIALGPALRAQPDKRLVALVREGYEAAFEEIVRRYDKALGRYATAIVGSRSEDVTQDAFSKALLALRRDNAEIELRPWLYRIVRNTALNELRDRPAEAEVLAEAIASGGNPAEELEQREELADLMKRLRALPESQRAAIVMRELEGLSHEEIAAALGLSGGAARQAIHRARTTLRNGAGLLLPLPLMRLLIDHGAEASAAGAGVGGAAAAGATVGGAGAGGALKAGVVAVVLAGSVGTGVALQERNGSAGAGAAAASGSSAGSEKPPAPPPASNSASNSAGDPKGKGSSEPSREESVDRGHEANPPESRRSHDHGEDSGIRRGGPPRRGGPGRRLGPGGRGGGDHARGPRHAPRGPNRNHVGDEQAEKGPRDGGAPQPHRKGSGRDGSGSGPGGSPNNIPPPPPAEDGADDAAGDPERDLRAGNEDSA